MKKLKKILKVFAIIIGSAVAFAFVMNLLNPFWFRFPKKIKTKEEMFSFVENNQEELEIIVEKLIVFYRESDMERNVFIMGKSYMESGFHEADDIIRNYSIESIWLNDDEEDGVVVSFCFDDAPAFPDTLGLSRSWGIRYVVSGEPVATGMAESEMEKQGNTYVRNVEGMYKYETERITGNWYYFQYQWVRP